MKVRTGWFRDRTVATFAELRRYCQQVLGPAHVLANRKARLNLIGLMVLLLGLGTALLQYVTSEDVPDDDLVYQIHHGKRYRHELQVWGGEMGLLEDDISVWFEGLWHGRSLAYTVAALTVIVSGGFFLVAHHLPAEPGSDA